jgi:transposase
MALGALNYHTGETLVLVGKGKQRTQIAELLTALLTKHPTQTLYLAWDNAHTHAGGEVEAVLPGAAGPLGLLYLPTYSPWLNPIEMLWPHWPREVTHCELFESIKKRTQATHNFFDSYNQMTEKTRAIIGAHAF